MKTAFLFPGQGAQSVSMGKDLCEAFACARDLFDRAEAVTGLELKTLCFEGTQAELSRTDIGQPAIFTVSAAALAVLDEVLGPQRRREMGPSCMAGLSLGEYTALYAAGAMDFETGVKLVARRGELMQQAAEAVDSSMVSVIGLDEAKARELCEAAAEGQVLTCANFNCPGQIVISGQKEACNRAMELAKQFGARMAVELQVAGAFHSELMQPAADELARTLAEVSFEAPKVSVIANVDAQAYTGAGDIPERLLAQLTSPVRWSQSVSRMLDDGVEQFYEIGPGKVLAGLMRRISRQADISSLNGVEAIEKVSRA